MTDIVESERTAGYWLGYHDGEKSGRAEAAAEIERLRTALEKANSDLTDALTDATHDKQQIAENAEHIRNLRAALARFCARVEAGEIRSRNTYAEFKALLSRAALEGK